MTTPRFPSLVDAVQAHAESERTAITWLVDGEREERSWSTSELGRRARAIAVSLRTTCQPGDRALLLVPPGLDFVAAYLGCLHAGVVAVPTFPPNYRRGSRSVARFRSLVSDARPSTIVTTSADRSQAWFFASREAGLGTLGWLSCDEVDLALADDWQRPELGSDSLAFLQYTSGSTSEPRGVAVTHGNLVQNQEAIATAYGLDETSTCMSWLPPFHDMGLIGSILQPLTVGYPVVLMSPQDFLRRPARWLQAVSRHRATISGGPDSAFALCTRQVKDVELEGVDLSSWTVSFNGSETVRQETLREFTERFASHGFGDAFFPSYGLAESTLLVSARRHSTDGETDVSCGAPAADHDLRIVDPGTETVLEDGAVGEVWVSGPSVASGYWNRDEESARTFGARLEGDDRRWLRTGDLGFLRDGELRVSGRLKDLLIVRGRNVYPQDLELTAQGSHPSLQPDACAAFATGEDGDPRLVIAAEVRRTARRGLDVAEVEAAVRTAIGEEHDVALDEVVLLPPATLPRTTSGKLRRHACRDAFLAESWSPLRSTAEPARRAAAPRSGTEAMLLQLVADLVEREVATLDPKLDLARLGVDSLLRVELLLSLESRLGRTLPLDTLDGDQSMAELAASLEQAPEPEHAASTTESLVGAELPLPAIQHDQLRGDVDPQRFGMFVYLRAPAGVDVDALESAALDLDRLHDALRLRFRREDDGWHQSLGELGTSVAFSRIDATRVEAPEELRRIRSEARERLSDGIDLEHGPVLHVALVDRGPDASGIIYVHCHHLVADATGVRVLLSSLRQGTTRARREVPVPLEARRPDYRDWLAALTRLRETDLRTEGREWLDSLRRARSATADETSPTGHRRLPRTALPAELADDFLTRHPTAHDQHDALLAIFLRALADVTDETEHVVELESHGRHPIDGVRPELVVGWCVHRYPVALDLSGSEPGDVRDAIERVRQARSLVPRDGLTFGLLPTELRDELARPRLSMSYRSRIDDPYRAETSLPVLDWAMGHAAHEAEQPVATRLSLSAGRRAGELWWELIADAATRESGEADAIRERMQELLTKRELVGQTRRH
ncbi:MAG: AMP-binding protein [Acidobacteriota bacterium]